MSLYDLIIKRRTIRRYTSQPIAFEDLSDIVNAGRLAPSASNLQPLEFLVVSDQPLVEFVFDHTKWAGYLPPEQGRPGIDHAPVAYIMILVNKKIRPDGGGLDVGAAAENMILTALERGIGSCWIGSIIDRPMVKEKFNVPEHFELDSLIAFGYADEEPMVEPLQDSIKYYKDADGRLHVPKRSLKSILHVNTF